MNTPDRIPLILITQQCAVLVAGSPCGMDTHEVCVVCSRPTCSLHAVQMVLESWRYCCRPCVEELVRAALYRARP